ncbi:uncharacterized protein SPSK_10805 [Sporothrix schenckii 1099-18]|uniref:Uncharacterized protein n=1 Tax=Sporothrix schenckii 1099-18 TaxID=1397361 RepID=A0A0F2MJ71_SPOSC|nr:uncharacterized protein SPSK_10805 [Sporothrix schenckii 1099-18]KJR88900.1 hypothetical protein SPSK_10805 [Sporothrix schenckii 1099-18]
MQLTPMPTALVDAAEQAPSSGPKIDARHPGSACTRLACPQRPHMAIQAAVAVGRKPSSQNPASNGNHVRRKGGARQCGGGCGWRAGTSASRATFGGGSVGERFVHARGANSQCLFSKVCGTRPGRDAEKQTG